jgi:Tol biopolymer transport system component
LTGEAIPMVEEVAESEGLPQFDLSSSGTLVYRRGREAGRVVVRVDPSGKVERITPAPGGFITPRFSPDGKRLAVVEISGVQRRILIYDLARGVANRLTLDDRAQIVPAWTPDGQYVVYQSAETMLAVRADGAGQPQPFLTKDERTTLSFSADGKRAVGSRQNTQTNRSEIWIAPVENTPGGLRFGKPVTVASSPGLQDEPVFSPDGRFIAYMSNESGTYQVYVVSLTPDGRAAGGKWQISNPTGYNPVWPTGGGQVFYDDGVSGQIHVVSYTANGDSFAAAPPRPWSPRPVSHYIAKMYDVAADGKQMVGILDDDSTPPETHLRLTLNFGDEIRRRLAGAAK